MKPSVREQVAFVGSTFVVTMAVLAVTGVMVIAAYLTPVACLGLWLQWTERREARSQSASWRRPQ